MEIAEKKIENNSETRVNSSIVGVMIYEVLLNYGLYV